MHCDSDEVVTSHKGTGRDGTIRRATEDKMCGDLRASRNLENVAAVLTNVSRLVFPNL